MHPDSIRRALLAAFAALLLATPIAAQEAQPDPAAAAAEQARQQAEASAAPRFVVVPGQPWSPCQNEPPEAERVQPTVPPGVDLAAIPNAAAWQVSAPRTPIRPGDQAALTLRDKAGTTNRMVYADVVRPDGTFARNGELLLGDRQATLSYPRQFSAGQPLVAGVYTVVWRDTITDSYIACDGFVVSP